MQIGVPLEQFKPRMPDAEKKRYHSTSPIIRTGIKKGE